MQENYSFRFSFGGCSFLRHTVERIDGVPFGGWQIRVMHRSLGGSTGFAEPKGLIKLYCRVIPTPGSLNLKPYSTQSKPGSKVNMDGAASKILYQGLLQRRFPVMAFSFCL